MASGPKPYFTLEQYLEFQAKNEDGARYEYEEGYLYSVDAPVPGFQTASQNHGTISGNLFRQISNKLETAATGAEPGSKTSRSKQDRAGPIPTWLWRVTSRSSTRAVFC